MPHDDDPPEAPQAPAPPAASQSVEKGPEDAGADEGNKAFDAQVAKDVAQIAEDPVIQEVVHDRLPSEHASGSGPTPMEKYRAGKMKSSLTGWE